MSSMSSFTSSSPSAEPSKVSAHVPAGSFPSADAVKVIRSS